MVHRLVLALVVLAIPLAAGCGDEGEEGGGETATAAQTIELSASDFEFDRAELTADPGEIRFELTNDGDFPHALEVEGEGVEEESETIQPGDTTELTVELDEGTYEIYCPVGDHKDRGMVGTLTVGGGGGGGSDTETTETETETGETETDESETGETETENNSTDY